VPPGVWVGLIVLGAAGFYYLWGSRTKTFQLDENQYVYLARWIDHTREAIFDFNLFGRGIQRLEVWLLAIPLGLMKGADALLTARALNSLAFASAAVPAFLLARGLGARAVWAVPASVLVVAGPWVVYATTFLTEPLAYPLVVWVIWSVWRATARPSLSSALVAVLLVALAALARTAFLLFAVLLPLTVVLQELRFGDWRGGSGAAERLRRYGANVWRHRVATLMIAGGAAAARRSRSTGASSSTRPPSTPRGWSSAPASCRSRSGCRGSWSSSSARAHPSATRSRS
jgi:hypothetical protein